ncbi:unnamed protein product [Diplocarpon coronariae]
MTGPRILPRLDDDSLQPESGYDAASSSHAWMAAWLLALHFALGCLIPRALPSSTLPAAACCALGKLQSSCGISLLFTTGFLPPIFLFFFASCILDETLRLVTAWHGCYGTDVGNWRSCLHTGFGPAVAGDMHGAMQACTMISEGGIIIHLTGNGWKPRLHLSHASCTGLD